MQCTPESNVYLESYKDQHCYDDCSDSGYSGLFHSPQSICSSLSPVEFSETPKENLRLSVTPKDRTREPAGLLGKDSRGIQRPSALSWCETPKVLKRDASLRHRLLMCKPTTDDKARSPCTRRTESSISVRSEHWLSASFDSVDTVTGAFASSTLKYEQDVPLSGRKRRLFFTQLRTSTLEDGKLNSGYLSNFERRVSLSEADFRESIPASDQSNIETPCFIKSLPASSKENSQSPVSSVTKNLYDSSSVLCTPSSTHTPKYIRYVLFLTLGFLHFVVNFEDKGMFPKLIRKLLLSNCGTGRCVKTVVLVPWPLINPKTPLWTMTAHSRSCCPLPPEETVKPQILQRQRDTPVCSVSTGFLHLKKGALSLRKTQQRESMNIFISATAVLKKMRFLQTPLAASFLLNVVIASPLQNKMMPPHSEQLQPSQSTIIQMSLLSGQPQSISP